MGDGILDIILFGLLAAFLIFKLGSLLGKRTGDEQRRPGLFGMAVASREVEDAEDVAEGQAAPPTDFPVMEEDSSAVREAAREGIRKIRAADRSFEVGRFLEGAHVAFKMVVEAFKEEDRGTLRQILSPATYEVFDAELTSREAEGLFTETLVISVQPLEIVAADLIGGSEASITVQFVSEQITSTRRTATGDVVEGDPEHVTSITDIWTFTRTLGTSDPNWQLAATDGEDRIG